MAIKDLQLPKLTVTTPGGAFVVRGLAPVEIEVLLREHRATFTSLFNRVKESGVEFDDGTLDMGVSLLSSAPELMARVICMAADEPDAIEATLRLPTAIQIDALTKIASLTFTVEGDLGKLLGAASAKVTGLGEVLDQVSSALAKIPTSKN